MLMLGACIGNDIERGGEVRDYMGTLGFYSNAFLCSFRRLNDEMSSWYSFNLGHSTKIYGDGGFSGSLWLRGWLIYIAFTDWSSNATTIILLVIFFVTWLLSNGTILNMILLNMLIYWTIK